MLRPRHRLSGLLLLAVCAAAPVRAQEDIPGIERRMRAAEAAGDLAGMMAQARRLEAVVKARYGTRHLNTAIVINNVGNAYKAQGRYAQAEDAYRAAIRTLETLPRQRDPELAAAVPGQIADTLVNLGNAYEIEGKHADAEAAHRRALAIDERILGPAHPKVAAALRALGSNLTAQGRLDEADAALRRALAILERAPGPGDADRLASTLNDLAVVALERGRDGEAEALLARALPIHERPGGRPDGLVAALNALSQVYSRRGRPGEAADLLQRALAIQERQYGPGHPRIAATLNNLGVVAFDRGRLEEAEGLHRRALAIREASLAPADPAIAQSLNNLSVVYRAQGRNAEAVAAIARAIPIFERALGPAHPTVAGNLENLAIAQRALGRLADAQASLERALAIQEQALPRDHPDLAGTLTNLGIVRTDRGEPRPAQAALERAVAIQERALGPQSPALIPTLNDLAAAYRADGRPRLALDAARRASAVILAHAPVAESGAEAGSGAFLRQNAEYLSRHLSALAAVEPDPGAGEAAGEAGREAFRIAQWAAQSAAAGALAQADARFAAGEGALAGLIREGQDLAAAWRAKDAALRAALSAAGAERGGLDGLRAEIAALRARLAEAEARIERADPAYAALSRPRPVEVEAARALLAPDEALLVLVPGPEDSAVLALTREGYGWRVIPAGADALAREVAALRAGLDPDAVATAAAAGGPDPFDPARAGDLYGRLLAPLEGVFRAKPSLLVVAAGPLTALPFHLLLTDRPPSAQDGERDAARDVSQRAAAYRAAPWLAKRHAVTVLPSVAGLAARRTDGSRPRAVRPMIGFGDPVFGSGEVATGPAAARSVSRGYGDFWQGAGVDRTRLAQALPALPETAGELRAVAAALGAPEADLHLGAAASEAAVKEAQLADYRVVYFATHGLVAGDVKGLGEPALALSLPARPSALDDGLLTASEIAQLHLAADWVVLSACNTAAGGRPGAEALSGLARAFFYAGGRALLVSHWAVDSEAATRLTTATFGALSAHPEIGRAEALRRAMLAVMGGPDARAAHPATWAPFAVVGDGAADRAPPAVGAR